MANARDDAVQKVLRHFSDEKNRHEQWVEQIEQRYKCYLGVVEKRDEARDVTQWTSQLTPKYAMQIAEGVAANLLDDRLGFKLKPWPLLTNQADIQRLMDGARAAELLLTANLDQDRFHQKSPDWINQAVITGLTATKHYWKTDKRTQKRRRLEVYSDIWGQQTGESYIPEEREVTLFDGPCATVVDIRGLMFAEEATSLDNTWLIHQTFETIDTLRKLEKQGYYKNISKIPQSKDEYLRDVTNDDFRQLEEMLWDENKSRGKIELLEFWSADGSEKITIANRNVHIDPHDRENPFWHGRKPFAVSNTTPYPFRIPGTSMIERLSDLQEYLWTLSNQRLDNVRLLNNAIFMIRDDTLDFEAFEFFPGAQWPVTDPQQITPWSPDPNVGRISMEAEAMIKADLLNIGGAPNTPGTQNAVSAETATAAAIATTIAQKIVTRQKTNILYGAEEMGSQFLGLDRQFLDGPKLIPRIGPDGAVQFETVFPDDIDQDMVVNVEPVTESLVRQEKRAEAIQLATAVNNMLPNLIGMGVFPNMKELLGDVFRSFDKDNIDRYFSTQGPPGLPGAPGGQGGAPAPGASVNGLSASGNGVTSDLATAPTAPSSPMSLSGQAAMQRASAMTGGANNVG